jgi:hypothetical protein
MYIVNKLYKVIGKNVNIAGFKSPISSDVERDVLLDLSPPFRMKENDIFLVTKIVPLNGGWSSKYEIQILYKDIVGWILSNSELLVEEL